MALRANPKSMSVALRNVPVQELSPPEGVVNLGGEWYFEEYTRGTGITSLGLEDTLPKPPEEEEKKGILDLFRR